MEKCIKITIDLEATKLSLDQLHKLYNIDKYDDIQDLLIGKKLEVAFYKKPSEISIIGKYI